MMIKYKVIFEPFPEIFMIDVKEKSDRLVFLKDGCIERVNFKDWCWFDTRDEARKCANEHESRVGVMEYENPAMGLLREGYVIAPDGENLGHPINVIDFSCDGPLHEALIGATVETEHHIGTIAMVMVANGQIYVHACPLTLKFVAEHESRWV